MERHDQRPPKGLRRTLKDNIFNHQIHSELRGLLISWWLSTWLVTNYLAGPAQGPPTPVALFSTGNYTQLIARSVPHKPSSPIDQFDLASGVLESTACSRSVPSLVVFVQVRIPGRGQVSWIPERAYVTRVKRSAVDGCPLCSEIDMEFTDGTLVKQEFGHKRTLSPCESGRR